LELFEGMARASLPRDAITYSATISALAKGKQWHAALQIFEHMQVIVCRMRSAKARMWLIPGGPPCQNPSQAASIDGWIPSVVCSAGPPH
jgi:pentatricopeptide repeat protein